MLNMSKVHDMTDVIHDSIPYSGIEHAVINTPIFNRLHRILQSSLVFLTYPSNKVKRFEHSVGVMHLAGNIFFSSICNSNPDTLNAFMERISNEIIEWRINLPAEHLTFFRRGLINQYRNSNILKAPIPKSTFYNKFRPLNMRNDQLFAYYVALQGTRLAGLLHDVGHLPYSHILEKALQQMYTEIQQSDDPRSCAEELFTNIMKRFVEGEDKDEIHEELGKLLVINIKESIIQDISNKDDHDLFFFLASFDFAERILKSKPSDNDIFSDLHLITSGVLDADRLDYCSRDKYCSGINKSIFGHDKLISTYKISKVIEDGNIHFYFCPSAKSVSSIEDLLRRRQCIFSEINYHHRVHKHETLLQEVICHLGLMELRDPEKQEDLTEKDSFPYTLPLEVSSIWKLIWMLNERNDWLEYQIIQLDDSWLDTLLKHKFFSIYESNYLDFRQNGNDPLWNRFDELISSTKRYFSFIKRANDFRVFDKMFFDKFYSYRENFSISTNTYIDFYNSQHSFYFNYILEQLCSTDSRREQFFEIFENNLKHSIKVRNIKITDCLLRSCMFSFGYKTAKTPLFISTDDSPIRIEQISSQLEIFQKERSVSPLFHVFYLPEYSLESSNYYSISNSDLMSALTDAAVETILNFNLT